MDYRQKNVAGYINRVIRNASEHFGELSRLPLEAEAGQAAAELAMAELIRITGLVKQTQVGAPIYWEDDIPADAQQPWAELKHAVRVLNALYPIEDADR